MDSPGDDEKPKAIPEPVFLWGIVRDWEEGEEPIAWALSVRAEETTDWKKGSFPGYLIVTNARIAFVSDATGLVTFSKNKPLSFKEGAIYNAEPLENILSVLESPASLGLFSMDRSYLDLLGFRYWNYLIISTKDARETRFFLPTKEEFNRIRSTIFSAKEEKLKRIKEEKEKERIHVVVDFGSLKQVLQSGGIVMTTLKCPNCGAPLKMPDTGKIVVCEHCQTPIKATDVFEKIKSLL